MLQLPLSLLLLVGAHPEVTRRVDHVSVPALGISAREVPSICPSCQSHLPIVTIDSLQPGHGWPPSGSRPGSTNPFRDHSAYQLEPRESRHVAK